MIPKKLFEIATNLGMVKVGTVEVHLHSESLIIKEALARGLRLMVIERTVSDKLAEKFARRNAVSIYTSLVNRTVEIASETTEKSREALAQLPEAEAK